MEDWGLRKRLVYGSWQAVGLGCIAGAMECVGSAIGVKLPLSEVDFLLMGLTTVAIMGLVGAVIGVGAGLATLPDQRPERTTADGVASQLAVTALFLCGFYLWQGAWVVFQQDRLPGAAAMAAMPLGFAGVVYFNARFWLRKTELGKAPKVGFLPLALGASILVLVASAVWFPRRDTGGGFALEGDRSVLIVTVEGLRASDLEPKSGVALPHLTQLAEGGFVYAQAVTPHTAPPAAAASVLTGLHPLRHRLLFEGDGLSLGYRTLADAFRTEGYATGGFVANGALGVDAGLEQGFHVFDDDVGSILAGVDRIAMVRGVRTLLELAGLSERVHGTRDAASTVQRFSNWYRHHSDMAHFGWVHLSAGPTELVEVDSAIGDLLAQVDEALRTGDTLVIVAGVSGRPQEGRRFLTDAEVHVPLIVRAPDADRVVPRVEAQVRLMDVGATVMDYVRLDTLGETEGVTLLGYGEGLRKQDMWCALVGKDEAGRTLLGLRNNGIKWVRDPDDQDHLFDLAEDPGEQTDIAEQQEATVRAARTLMSPDIVAFRRLEVSR